MMRTAWANSKVITMWSGVWMIWNGNGMYMMRGTPGRKHWRTGSSARRFSKFSCRRASASSRYGMVSPTTTLRPAGTPSSALCASTFQEAALSACQMPLRSGCSGSASA